MNEMQSGLVSVILPFANAARFLREAIDSVLAQSHQSWELLLVDDGATDGSTVIAQSYAAEFPEKVRYLSHPDRGNHGVTRSRNLGASHARGQYIAILDADDVWLPEMLENRVADLERHPDAGLAYGPSEYWFSWDEAGSQEPDSVPPVAPADRLYLPPYLLLHTHPIGIFGAPCPSSFVMRREAFAAIGGFVEEFCPATRQLYEDTAFLSKAYLKIPVYVGGRCLERYRCDSKSIWHRSRGTSIEESERSFYFRWLRRDLKSERITDPEIWKAVRRAGWMYWMPLPAAFTRLLRRAANRLRR